MSIPERPQSASIDPRFRILRTDDGSSTLVEVSSGDTFHSGCGAKAECLHVYLRNSGVENRLRAGIPTAVLEIGFGTGMSFVLTAAEAIRGGATLRYTALEQRPLGPQLLRQVLGTSDSGAVAHAASASHGDPDSAVAESDSRSAFAAARESLLRRLDEYPVERTGIYDLAIAPKCTLRLIVADAVSWSPGEERFDAIYFDPFSPASNPELWELPVLRRLHASLRPQGRLVSYCVNRVVRDRLQAVGFHVARVAGPPGGKREVLVASRQ